MRAQSARREQGKSGVSGKSDAAASDEERSSRRHSGSSSEVASVSSSEDEQGDSRPPSKKRRRFDKLHTTREFHDQRIDSLIDQVNCISGYLTHLPHYIRAANQGSQSQSIPGSSTKEGQNSQSSFLINPCMSTDKFQLGDLKTDFDEKKVIPPSKKDRLEKLNQLQHFETQAWKGMRYKSTLGGYSASPGFVSLKVNEELCHFNKTKDYLASAENMLAGLTNAELERQELLKQGLQELLNWAAGNPGDLNLSSLFEKVSALLGPGSSLHKSSEKTMQIICGRRAECIEIRRDRILKEINSPMLKAMLRDIPPSAEYLFSKQALQPVIQSLGGSQTWLNKPEYIKDKGQYHSRPISNSRSERRPTRNAFNNRNIARANQTGKNNNLQALPKRHDFRGGDTRKNNVEQIKKQTRFRGRDNSEEGS